MLIYVGFSTIIFHCDRQRLILLQFALFIINEAPEDRVVARTLPLREIARK